MTKLKSIWDYKQPDFYHFSEDSIWISKEACRLLANLDISNLKLLDLCAGCGVIGLEIIVNFQKAIKLDAIELQEEFKRFFELNLHNLGDLGGAVNFIYQDFRNLYSLKNYQNQYDIVVSNPPFFCSQTHQSSSCMKKNVCRFFINGSFADFLKSSLWMTKSGGTILFLARDFKESIMFDVAREMNIQIETRILGEKSGTFLIMMFVIDKY